MSCLCWIVFNICNDQPKTTHTLFETTHPAHTGYGSLWRPPTRTSTHRHRRFSRPSKPRWSPCSRRRRRRSPNSRISRNPEGSMSRRSSSCKMSHWIAVCHLALNQIVHEPFVGIMWTIWIKARGIKSIWCDILHNGLRLASVPASIRSTFDLQAR